MKNTCALMGCVVGLFSVAAVGAPQSLLKDAFERSEADDKLEQVGNGWGTNSQKRAKGVKQANLKDGALHIKRAAVADHGVSVTHEVAFRDAEIRLRFKFDDAKDRLGINIADMNEKSVHAGHICMAKFGTTELEISDLKTGKMNLASRRAREKGPLRKEEAQRLKIKSKKFRHETAVGEWHTVLVKIQGETMTVAIDGEAVGSFASEGIGHPTKSRLRLAVDRQVWVDDVEVVGE